MFSSRVPSNLAPNRLTQLLDQRRREGADILDLTASNPTRAGFDYPPSLFEDLPHAAAAAYEPVPFGLPAARQAVADHLHARVPALTADRILLTASTSEAYALLFKLLCDPGDEVLAPCPSYPLFEHLARFEGVVLRTYNLEFHGQWEIGQESLESALSPRTRAILFVSPNNPTGSFVAPDDLRLLQGVCRERGLALIADEVFADYPVTYSGRPPSVLDSDDVLAFSLGGLSKTVGLPHLKVSWVAAAGPDDQVSEALARLELVCDTYLSVSTPLQRALPRLLREGRAIHDQIAARVVTNYRQLRARAEDHRACQVLPVEGGWYAVVRVPATRPEESLVLDLLEHRQVLVHPGYFFDFSSEAYLVSSLIVEPPIFDEGVARIFDFVESW